MPAGVLTVALAVFGPWQPVTVAEIHKDVPLWQYTSYLGAVQKPFHIRPGPGCPVVEDGKTVGWSMSCKN